jgi:hypothetical protein
MQPRLCGGELRFCSEPAQQAGDEPAQELLQLAAGRWGERVELHRTVGILEEHSVGYQGMKMKVQVQR